MLKDFRDFAMRGNVVDLAVGFILGGAFATIVQSLVNDILMPPIGMALNGADFTELFIPLDGQVYDNLDTAREVGAATINYGLFVNAVISFVIMAFALFVLIGVLNRTKKKQEEAPGMPVTPPRQEQLLTEIRDLLARERDGGSQPPPPV